MTDEHEVEQERRQSGGAAAENEGNAGQAIGNVVKDSEHEVTVISNNQTAPPSAPSPTSSSTDKPEFNSKSGDSSDKAGGESSGGSSNNNKMDAIEVDKTENGPVGKEEGKNGGSQPQQQQQGGGGGGGGGMTFDGDSQIYYANACCELLHYRVAAVVVGVLEILMIAGWLATNVIFYNAVGLTAIASIPISVQVILALVAIGCIGLMFAGIAMDRGSFLWPHMIFQILGIAAAILLTIVAVVSMAAGTHIAETVFGGIFGDGNLPLIETALGPIWPFCLAVIFDFAAAIGIWFYILVRGAYDYYLDKAFFQDYLNKNKGKKRQTVYTVSHTVETKA